MGRGATVHVRPRPIDVVIAVLSRSRGPASKPCRSSGCPIIAPRRNNSAHLRRGADSGDRNGSRQGAVRDRDASRRGHMQNHIGSEGLGAARCHDR
jgi:hypothetical protein